MTRMSQTITFVVSLFACITLGGRLLDRGAGLAPVLGLFFGALALGMTLMLYVRGRGRA